MYYTWVKNINQKEIHMYKTFHLRLTTMDNGNILRIEKKIINSSLALRDKNKLFPTPA